MKLFNTKKEQTSNDYYEAYKAEIGAAKEEKKFFSLNNFLKLEILAVAAGFLMMNQQSLTSEYKQLMAGDDSLPVSEQYANLDKELVVTQEEDDIPVQVAIREDVVMEDSADKDALVDNSDLKLLIELLKSEMKESEKATSNNRIIISQN